MARESFAVVAKRRLLGLLLLVVIAGLIALSIAIYNKAFTTTVDVTMRAGHTGNELLVDSDVKERGVIVGSVKSVTSQGDGAILKLALEPGRVNEIPKNVKAQILPKTLFGEQYVALIIPQRPTQARIKGGDVIPQDRSKGALETEKVLGDMLPLLTAVQPAELNATLTALSQALANRGNELGQTLVTFDSYLKKINPHTQQLADDLGKLGRVSLEYNNLAPDIVATLKNLQVSARTVIDRRAGLDSLLTSGTDMSNVLRNFLSANRNRLIEVTGQTTKIYGLLDQYSPEFACLLAGVNNLYKLEGSAIYDHRIHLGVIIDRNNMGRYSVRGRHDDRPIYITGQGPSCFGLPNNPQPTDRNGRFQIPEKLKCFRDGRNGGALTRAGEQRNCNPQSRSSSESSRMLNSPEEDAFVNSLVATELGTTPNRVPGAATILAAPLLRGQQVVVK